MATKRSSDAPRTQKITIDNNVEDTLINIQTLQFTLQLESNFKDNFTPARSPA